jgi:ABC-type multidrug transport system permease subunit
LIIAAFYGSIYYQLPGGTDPTVYNNRLSILYFTLMSFLMNHQEEIASIHENRLVFYRERAANIYSVSSYCISRLLTAIPIDLFNVFIFAVTLYYLTGLRNGGFGFFLMICWLTDFISLFICQFLAYISPSTDIAMSLFPVILFFASSFEGFIIYIPQFPDWLSWGADL